MQSPEPLPKFPTQLPSNETELMEELNATEEHYVRKKLTLGGYKIWEIPIVKSWLAERAAERTTALQEVQIFWARMAVYVAAVGLFMPTVWQLLQTATGM